MYTTNTMQDEILRLKKEKDICILAHVYQSQNILEVADYIGDSYALSQHAARVSQKNILVCGVPFMAETVKILSPEKKVLLANPHSGCPMAEQIDINMLRSLKESYPDHTVVAYINTTAELKTLCDVCVTSSSAVRIINHIDNPNILFIPDCNLGSWVSGQCPDKAFQLVQGGCPSHMRITLDDVCQARACYPQALLLVHPECLTAISNQADYVGSTTDMINFVISSDFKEFIIGTENNIIEHLQFQCPDKMFYPLSKDCVCNGMRITTLADVLNSVTGIACEEIILSNEVILSAKRCIDTMLTLGSSSI